MDRITLRDIKCRCRIGVPAAERRKKQTLRIDAALETGLRRAGRSDDLRHSVDYFALERRLRETAESVERRLIERLAEDLARTALRFDRRIRAVTITVRKKPALMPQTGVVEVTVRRARP
ncbi:MAG: dihydroneopterin aldolase [Elusimicrobiota bacterium]